MSRIPRRPLRPLLAAFLLLFPGGIARAQFRPEEIGQRAVLEEYLAKARIVGSLHILGPEAVTSPWKLTLSDGEATRFGLWKNPSGRLRGHLESWKTEIAAYRLDKALDLGMVPPTIERRFDGAAGSLQLWVESEMSLKALIQGGFRRPASTDRDWNRAFSLQRAFDNLIANEDRHASNVLITKDWRIILIDHSRSFRTARKFTTGLIYSKSSPGGDQSPDELPRAFAERIKALTPDSIAAATGGYLTEDQIRALLKRRDLVLADIERLIREKGEDRVLY